MPSISPKTSFFSGVVAELRQVEWPTRDVVVRSFGIIIGICITVSIFVAGLDFLLTALIARLGEML